VVNIRLKTYAFNMGAANTNAINDVYEIVVTDADRETAKTVWNMKDIPFQVEPTLSV